MKRVASLYLPNLSIERLRRIERAPPPSSAGRQGDGQGAAWLPAARLPENAKERARLVALRERLEQEAREAEEGGRIEDCSCPRGGGWRPGAKWANREELQARIDALPEHQRPAMRMLGRRTEAAEAPFRRHRRDDEGSGPSQPFTPSALGRHGLLATTHRVGQRVVLAAVSPKAAALGLHPGMAVTQARALVPGLELRDADQQADAAFLTRLALFAARRWTPCAALSEGDGLWLDISGVAHLFGGERRLCARILSFCARIGVSARIAVAGTTGAAHALARFSDDEISLCPSGAEADAIAPLPVAALRLGEPAIAAARRFGIETAGELIAMPRGPLARRFGKALLLRLDQALGRVAEPFDPVVPQEPPTAALRFAEPIASAEVIEEVLRTLVMRLVALLERHGIGARRATLICERVDGEEQRLAVGTARATRDGEHLLRLLAMKIEAIDPGFGIEAMRLAAGRCEPLAPRQTGSDDELADLPPLVDRIASRIGAERIFRLSAVESDVPERSVRRLEPLSEVQEWPRRWARPVRLLARPEPVDKVIAELPDQPPLRFSWRGKTHRVRKADGPERIHGEWWKRLSEADAVRDYFQVEDESGARFWMFRKGDGEDGRTGDLSWYMHGLFG
jgi:protein ImuB